MSSDGHANGGIVRQSRPRILSFYSRKTVTVWLVGVLLLAAHAPAFADGPKVRCAIIVNQGGSDHGELVADLFAVTLADGGFGVVDRSYIADILAEHKLAQAFSDADPAARRLVGDVAGADLLVLLTGHAKDKEQALEWTVAAMPSGLRLASGVSVWKERRADKTLHAILESVCRADRQSRNKDLQLVCVPAFQCSGPTFDHDGRQASFAKLTEEILLATPNVAVVALAEVDALKRETQISASDIVRRVPLTIMGSFETQRTVAEPRCTVEIKLLAAGETLGVRRLADLNETQVAPALSKALIDLLRDHSNVRVQAPGGGEVSVLIDQALAFIAVGSLEDAIPLLRTAVLLDPTNVGTRLKLFWAWNGLAGDMTRVRKKIHSVERVEMLQNTLDEFEEIARRRPLTKNDVYALSQTRGHGHAYGANKRSAPEFVSRYHEYCTRFRAVVRKLYEGDYGAVDEDTRREAWRLLVQRFGTDCYGSPDSVYAEMQTLLRQFASENNKNVEIFEILLQARSRAGKSRRADKDFWNACCPPQDKRMAVLAALAEALREPNQSLVTDKFEVALTQAKLTLKLTEHDVDRIQAVAERWLNKAEVYSRRHTLGKLAVMPRVELLAGLPNEKVTAWLTSDASEFVITSKAVYRVTPQLEFKRIYEVENAVATWDSQYLWIATDKVIEVIDSNGRLIARTEMDAKKYLTPMAAGKVFVARHDLSDLGAKRAAHEIWTLQPGDAARLEHELLYVADRNSTVGIRWQGNLGRRRGEYLRSGQLIEDAAGRGPYLFFSQNSQIMAIDSHEFRRASGKRPRNVWYGFQDGVHYWIAGFRISRGGLRSRAVFHAGSPETDAELVADLGWVRYRGNSALYWQPAATSMVLLNGWLHFIDRDHNCPPQWVAIQLRTGDVRALALAIFHFWEEPVTPYYGRHRVAYLIDSTYFGLLLRSKYGTVYRVELPPEDTWVRYDEVVKELRVPPGAVDFDPWKDWRSDDAGDRPQR